VLDQVSSTTNHPAIIEYKGQWYMVYHNAGAPGGGNFRQVGHARQALLERRRHHAEGRADHRRPDATNLALSRHPLHLLRLALGDPRRDQGRLHPGQLRRITGHGAYGNWDHQGTEWVEVPVAGRQSISKVQTYWFDDDLGIDLPASCQIQYWNGSAYVNVAGQSVLRRRRKHLQPDERSPGQHDPAPAETSPPSPGYSTGILEWRALS
jgi:hypothetical protein